jgi:hypothetical protein
MKSVIGLAAVMAMLGTALPSIAQAGGAAQAGVKATTGKTQPQPAGPKATPKPKAKPKPKPKATAKPSTKKAKKPATKTATTTPAPTVNGSTMAGTSPSVTAATPTIPVVKNQYLEARLQPLLPNGMHVSDAAKGFKNWGRFVAAVHASRNLNIPFQTLKAKMTGDMPLSLGQAIQAIRSGAPRPTAVITQDRTATTASAVTQAEQQAAEDFRHVRDDNH